MLKNSYKFLFFNTMVFGTLISISSNSWFGMWMGLEINLLSFIPLMMTQKNLFSSEASLKYFLTQALASSILLFSILIFYMFLNFKVNYSYFFSLILSFTLLLKSGVAPFHFWFPSVMEGLGWMSNLVIMTWQKIAPLMILSYCLNLYLLILIILFSVMFGSLGGLNQTSLRKLLAFSSINHLGWMMAGLFYNENLWFLYFCFYVFLNFNIILMFNNFKLFNMNQIFNYLIFNFIWKFFIFCILLSLGGLPPFLGFFPKWIIIEMMIYKNMMFILFFMVFCSLITLFFYLRISYSVFLMNYYSLNWNFKENFSNFYSKILNFFSFFSLFGIIFVNFFYNFMNF